MKFCFIVFTSQNLVHIQLQDLATFVVHTTRIARVTVTTLVTVTIVVVHDVYDNSFIEDNLYLYTQKWMHTNNIMLHVAMWMCILLLLSMYLM